MTIDVTLVTNGKTYTGTLNEVSDEIKIVWVTDSHTRFGIFPERITALDAAIVDANTWADYFVHTGDMATGDWNSLDFSFKRMRGNLSIPFLWCLGNHDEEEFTYGPGNPNTQAIETITGQLAPFYFSQIITSSDNSLKVLVLSLDCNFYADDPNDILISPDHQPGDRRGISSGTPPGGYWRQFGQAQLGWIQSELDSNPSCNAIILLCHYIPVGQRPVDFELLGDILQNESRSKIILSGHRHQDASTWTLNDSNGDPSCTVYKMMALQDCLGHCKLRIALENNEIAIKEALVVATGEINGEVKSPFTVNL